MKAFSLAALLATTAGILPVAANDEVQKMTQDPNQWVLQTGDYAKIAKDVLRPSAEELRANPRSASAKLRWAKREVGRQ